MIFSKMPKKLFLGAALIGLCSSFATAMEPKKLRKGKFFSALYWAAAGAQSMVGLGIYGLVFGMLPKDYENDSKRTEIKDQKYLAFIRNGIQQCGVSPDTIRIMNGPDASCAIRIHGPSYIFMPTKDEKLFRYISNNKLYPEKTEITACEHQENNECNEIRDFAEKLVYRMEAEKPQQIINNIQFSAGHEARHIANKHKLKEAALRIFLPAVVYGSLRSLTAPCWRPAATVTNYWLKNCAKLFLTGIASLVDGVLVNQYRAKNERQADIEAAVMLGSEATRAAAKDFEKDAQRNGELPDLLHAVFYHHPKNSERARYLNTLARELEDKELKNKAKDTMNNLNEKLKKLASKF